MIRGKDHSLLKRLATFRIATADQLAVAVWTSQQMVRKRLRRLEADQVIEVFSQKSTARGRPENLYSLTAAAIPVLHEAGVLPETVDSDMVTRDGLLRQVEHQLVLNDLLVECAKLHRDRDDLIVKVVSSTCPFNTTPSGMSILHDSIVNGEGKDVAFTPDAVFAITNRQRNKALLFMVEIDMQTEPRRRRSKPKQSDIQKKLVAYRAYLARKGYRRHKETFGRDFRGFRLLLVAHTFDNRERLSRIVVSAQPSEFVWVTDIGSIRKEGLSAPVWRRGGQADSHESILGTAALPPPQAG